MPGRGLYDRVLEEVERPLIQLTLAATRGNQVRAAAILGLNRNTLRKKIQDLDLPVVRGPGLSRASIRAGARRRLGQRRGFAAAPPAPGARAAARGWRSCCSAGA